MKNRSILAFFADSYGRIRSRIRVLGVIADSGFYLKQFIDTLEKEQLAYIIAVKLFQPLQRQIYAITQWKEVAKGLSVSEFSFMHPLWGNKRRYIVIRQDIMGRTKAMGKTLPLFAMRLRSKITVTASGSPTHMSRRMMYGLCANPGQTMRTPSGN
jgi:hypothetical protein